MIAAGVNAKAITAYLGHASIQTTFDLYGHLMPGNEDEAVALVDAYLERASTDPPDRPAGSVSESATVSGMSESLRVTIVYEHGEDGWIVASIPEVPGANSQGRRAKRRGRT